MRQSRRTSKRVTSNGKTVSFLLRGIDRELINVFKARAERQGRSLQAELQLSLRREAQRNFEEARAISEQWQSRLAGRTFNETKAMIDEDRRR